MASRDLLLIPELKNCFLMWAQGTLSEAQDTQLLKIIPSDFQCIHK